VSNSFLIPGGLAIPVLSGTEAGQAPVWSGTEWVPTIITTGAGQNINTLSNGLNSNVATGGQPTMRLSGPNEPFSIGGLAIPGSELPSAGQSIELTNTTSQLMTIVHEDTLSTAMYRIAVGSGVSVALPPFATARFLYDGTSSRWKLQNAGLARPTVVHVADFGALGDGTTDDTAAIQSAMTAAGVIGGTLMFEAGASYRVTATINVTGPCKIQGRGATLIPNIPDANLGQIIYVQSSNVTIDEVYFDYSVNLAGTVSVTNGSPTVMFSQSQSLATGTPVTFASQPGVPYKLASAVSGTTGTLVAGYTGSPASTTTTVASRATGNETNRYCVFVAGASDSEHIDNVVVRNCRMTNISTGQFPNDPTNVLACSAIWVQWADHVTVEGNYINLVSGFGVFTEATNYVTIRNNTIINSGWASIVSNSGDNWWLCEGNSISGNYTDSRDEGGSIAIDGTPSDGFGPTFNSVVRNNYVTGAVAYGCGVRLGSVQNCIVQGNIFDQLVSGVGFGSYTPPGYGPAVISADTRGSQPFACRNLQILDNIFIACSNADFVSSTNAGIGAIQVENNDWSGVGTPGRGGPVRIAGNLILSPSQGQSFTQAVLVHGQTGGIDGVDVHDNQGTGWCQHDATIAAFCSVTSAAATVGGITDAHVHHNRWQLASNLSGTVEVQSGQPGIVFSVAQSLPSGTAIVFAEQSGNTYTLSGAVTGTTGTLSGNYTGMDASATTATVTNNDQIGNLIGAGITGMATDHNVVNSFLTPTLLSGSNQTSIQILDTQGGTFGVFGPVGGYNAPLQYQSQSIGLSHGGLVTISTAVGQYPELLLSDTGLTGASTLKLPTTSGPTEWTLDFTDVSFAGHTVTVEVGTAAKTLAVTSPGVYRVRSDGIGSIYYWVAT
jgi:Right handed beta helix region